jgi:predicted nuclease with TOPRIM domain
MSEDLTDKLPKSDSEKLNRILTTTQNLEERFEKLEVRVNSVDARLENLERTVDQKLHDTRPIWHKVVADIAQLQTGQDAMRERMLELNSTVRDVNRDQIVINDVLRRIQLDFHNIDDRLHRIDLNRNRQNSST